MLTYLIGPVKCAWHIVRPNIYHLMPPISKSKDFGNVPSGVPGDQAMASYVFRRWHLGVFWFPHWSTPVLLLQPAMSVHITWKQERLIVCLVSPCILQICFHPPNKPKRCLKTAVFPWIRKNWQPKPEAGEGSWSQRLSKGLSNTIKFTSNFQFAFVLCGNVGALRSWAPLPARLGVGVCVCKQPASVCELQTSPPTHRQTHLK